MAGVRKPPPKDPNSVSDDVKEKNLLQPPGFSLFSEETEPWFSQILHSCYIVFRGFMQRQHFGRRRLRQSHKFAKESALGKQLCFRHNGEDAFGLVPNGKATLLR